MRVGIRIMSSAQCFFYTCPFQITCSSHSRADRVALMFRGSWSTRFECHMYFLLCVSHLLHVLWIAHSAVFCVCGGVVRFCVLCLVCGAWCDTLKKTRVYIKNVAVCTGTTPTCFIHVGVVPVHTGDVLNVHMEGVLNVHTETCSMNTPLLPSPPPTHTTTHNTTNCIQQHTTTQHSTTQNNTEHATQKQREEKKRDRDGER